jgi:hypothetical protein
MDQFCCPSIQTTKETKGKGKEKENDRAKVSDLSMRSQYVDLVGGVRA